MNEFGIVQAECMCTEKGLEKDRQDIDQNHFQHTKCMFILQQIFYVVQANLKVQNLETATTKCIFKQNTCKKALERFCMARINSQCHDVV